MILRYPGETWAADEVDRVMSHVGSLRTVPQAALDGPLRGAGEWDWLRSTPRKARRRLIGSGLLTAHGQEPDVVADQVAAMVPGVDHAEALTWLVRMGLLAIGQRRRAAHWERHARRAAELGHPTWYAYRRAVAVEHGHGSYHYMAVDRGWRPLAA